MHDSGRHVAGSVRIDGQPAKGVTVRVSRIPDRVEARLAVTDAAGRFDLGMLSIGKYMVVAEKKRFTGAIALVDIRDPMVDPEHLTLVLHDCVASVHGSVRDTSGGSIAGARVSLSRDGMTAGTTAQSDSSGDYELCIPPGEDNLIVIADGYAETTSSLSAAGRVRRDFLLAPEAVVAGRVVRANDRSPVADSLVTLRPAVQSPNHVVVQTRTDEEGRFRFTGASPGRHSLVAEADGLVSARPMPVLAEVGAGQDDLICELVPAAPVRGTVTARGRGVPGARVVLAPRKSAQYMLQLDTVSQADGSFSIEHAVPGEYTISVEGYEGDDVDKTITVPRGGLTALKIEVKALASISGRVVHHGRPIGNARVSAGKQSCVSDEDGRYSVRGLTSGSYRVYAMSDLVGMSSSALEVTVADGEQKEGIDLELDVSASISGVVLDQDGVPVSGVVVSFSLVHGNMARSTMTNEDGTFKVANLLSAGAYAYQVRPTASPQWAYDTWEQKPATTVTVQDERSQVSGVVIKIKHDRLSISGRVVDANGQPLPDVFVRVGIGEIFGRGMASTITDVSGAFTIRDLPRGVYLIRATSATAEASITDVSAGRSDVVFRMPTPASVQGTLEGFDAVPDVVAIRKDAMPDFYLADVRGNTFAIDGMPPGTYEVQARSSAEYASFRVSVAQGEHIHIAMRGQPFGSISGVVLDAETRQPLSNFRCSCGHRIGGGGQPLTDSLGRFRLDGVAPGEVEVYCSREGRRASAKVAIAPLQASDVVLVSEPENVRPR